MYTTPSEPTTRTYTPSSFHPHTTAVPSTRRHLHHPPVHLLLYYSLPVLLVVLPLLVVSEYPSLSSFPTLDSLFPPTRPIYAIGPVTVNGTGFTAYSYCRFTDASGWLLDTAAVYTSSSSIDCPLPPPAVRTVGDQLSLYVSAYDTSYYSLASLYFQFTANLTLTSFTPDTGTMDGGSLVTITGGLFTQSALTACRFNDTVIVTAVYFSSSSIGCLTPTPLVPLTNEAAAVDVEVTDNGQDFVMAATQFTYLPPITLVSLSPSSGPTAYTTLIDVTLQSNPLSYPVYCRIGRHVFSATVVAGSVLQCASPSTWYVGNQTLLLSYDPLHFHSTLRPSSLNFTYYTMPAIAAVEPILALTTAATTLNLTISPSIDNSLPAVSCLFDGVVSGSGTLGGGWVTCIAPALTGSEMNVSSNVAVSLQLDGQQYTNSIYVTYTPRPYLLAVYPSSYCNDQQQTLYVLGAAFVPSSALSCIFVDSTAVHTTVAATYLSTTMLTCTTPLSSLYMSSYMSLVVTNSPSSPVYNSSSSLTLSTPATVLSSIVPSVGSTALPFYFLLSGSGFTTSHQCAVDLIPFPLTVYSSTSAACHTGGITVPSSLDSTAAIVRLIDQNGNTTVSWAAFTYGPNMRVTSVDAEVGSWTGGVAVQVNGSAFMAGCVCQWNIDGTLVNTSVLSFSNTSLTCRTANASAIVASAAAYPLMTPLSIVTAFFASNPVAFTFLTPATITALSPSFGVVAHNTTITVLGASFLPTNPPLLSLSAAFVVQSTYLSANAVLVQLMGALWQSNFSGGGSGLYQLNGINVLGLQLTVASTDELTKLATPLNYTLYNASAFTSITPTAGPITGSSLTTIAYSSPIPTVALLCRFDAENVLPMTASVSSLVCVSPSHVATGVTVWVSINNGTDWEIVGQYTYMPAISVTSLSPQYATGAGAVLTVTGSGLSAVGYGVTAYYNASGAVTPSACTIVSSVLLHCTLPNLPAAAYTLSLSNNGGHDVYASAFAVTVLSPLSVSSISPSSGPITGGTLVLVKGAGFIQASTIFCSFPNSLVVAALYISSSTVLCTSPSSVAAVSALEVGVNTEQWTSNGRTFTYYPQLSLTSFTPLAGPAGGGTLVTVTGSGFIDQPSLRCTFDSQTVSAVYVSPTSLVCASPPLLATGNVTLGVANNAADYVYATPTYAYYPAPSVASVSPSFIPIGSATAVTVSGSGFTVSSLAVFCGFNSTAGQLTATNSTNVTSSTVTCPSPAPVSTTTYRLLLSINGGSDWLDTGLYLHAYTLVSLSAVYPATVSVSSNVLLTVTGSGFVSNTAIVCSTAGTITPATYINATTMLCLAPYSSTPGTVLLSLLASGGLAYSSNSLSLTYQPVTTVLAPSPTTLLSTGGTLTFSASWVSTSLQLFCLFAPSSSAVPAVVLTSTSFSCSTPPLQPTTTASVRVLSSYQPTIDYSFTFVTVLPPAVLTVSPSSGQIAGGTLVTVSGINLLLPATCQFTMGGLTYTVSASSASATQLTCLTPAFSSSGLATVQVNTLPAGTYTTSSTATFYYLPAPVLWSVSLPTVPLMGGVLVTVTGSGLLDTATLQCGFDVTSPSTGPLLSAPAIARSSTSMECVVPSLLDDFNSTATAQLLVSINGVEWYTSALSVTYLPAMQLVDGSYAWPLSDTPLLSIDGESLLSFPVAPILTLRCVFDCGSEELSTAASVFSDTLLQCLAAVPPSFDVESLACSLRVTDGVFTSSAALSVTYYQTSAIAALSSVLLAPSASLTVIGSAFPPSPLCVFSFSNLSAAVPDETSTAYVISSAELACTVPSFVAVDVTTPYYVRVSSALFTSSTSTATLPFLPLLVVPPATIAAVALAPSSSYPSVLTFTLSNTDGSYVDSGLLSCVDESSNTWPAVWLNASSLLCVLPAADFLVRPSFTLYVTNDGVTLSNGLLVVPPPLPVVLSVVPVAPSTAALLQTGASDVLTVSGQYFQQSSTLSCVLDGLYLPAVYINDTVITCNLTAEALSLLAQINTASLPTVAFSSLPLTVTNDGVQPSLTSAAVSFLRTPLTASISPTHADPSDSTSLTVSGQYFTATARCAFCSFAGDADSCQFEAAVWTSSTLVQCIVPVLTAGRWMVAVVNDVSTLPFVPVSSAVLTLSTITLSTVSLSYGPAAGGTSLTIVGSDFMPPPAVSWCVFDLTDSLLLTSTDTMYATTALYLNATAVSCATPAHSVGAVTVDVLIDTQLSSPPSLSFNFTYDLLALSLSPSYASLVDTLDVTVTFDYTLADYLDVVGSSSPELFCSWDGIAVSNLTVLNSTAGECEVVIRWVSGGYVSQLSVVDASRLYATPALSFTVLPLLNITSFTPTVGPLTGGLLLTVTGSGFASLPDAPLCWFNFTASATASVLSNTKLTCIVPAATATGPVPVQLSTTPTTIATLPQPFLYLPVPVLSFVQSPAYVNTSLLISGSSFYASSSLVCLFASSTAVAGTFYNATTIYCPLPLLYGISPNTTVNISVTNDGYTYPPGLSFLYLVLPLNTPTTLTSLSPATSPTAGGLTVTIAGAGFTDTVGLVCRFDVTVVPAVYVNGSAVTCVAPAYAAGVVSVSVANDELNYCGVQLAFTYIGWPLIGGVVASFGGGGQLLLTVTGTSFPSSAVCAFLSNSTAYYPHITSAELPHLPVPFLSSPVSIGSTTQLTCAAPPLSAFYSPTTAAHGAFTSLTSLSSLTDTIVSLAILPSPTSPYVQAYPFTYHSLAVPSITSLAHAAYTSSSASWRIDVYGQNFVDAAPLACRLSVAASLYQPLGVQWMAPTHVVCWAVAANALVPVNGSGVLSVTNDGWTWVTAPQPVVFYSTPTIDWLAPASVPLTTLLNLTVASNSGWLSAGSFASPLCEVAGALYAAVYLNSSAVRCAIPAAALVTFTSAVPVQLSLDGSAWSNTLMLQPLVLATISSVYPPSVPVSGGTVLTVLGSGFTSATKCVVHFDVNSNNGELTVAASAVTITSNSSLRCTLPASPSLYPQRARIELYNDASQLTMSYPLSAAFVTYTAAATITSFSPTYGPAMSAAGPVVLTVLGSGFTPLPTLACLFSSTSMPALNATIAAVYSNSTIVYCTIATLQASNLTYTVQLTNDGLSFLTPASSTFTFLPAPVVSAVSPSIVDWSMVAVLTVTGSSLFSTSPALSTYCVFNQQMVVLASAINASAVSCTLPAASTLFNASMPVAVAMQLGSSVRSLASKLVQYVPSPVLVSVSPSMGPQAGGVVLTIIGANLLPVSYSSTMYVTLNSTSTSSSALITVISHSSTSVTFTLPAWPTADLVNIAVLIRPSDTPTSLLAFTYLTPPTLTSLSPTAAPYHGGSVLTVSGSTFPSIDITCQFGSLVSVPAVRVDSTHVECVTPLLYANANVNVSLSLGPLVQSSNSLPFVASPLNLVTSSMPSPSSGLLTLSVGQWLSFNLSVVNVNQSLTCRFDGSVDVLAVLSAATWTGSCRLMALQHSRRTSVSVELLDDWSTVIYSSSFLYQPLAVITATSLSASLAQGGDTLTLSGAHLRYQQLTCTFTDSAGTVNSSVTVFNDTTAQCNVPSWPAAATVTLQVWSAMPLPSLAAGGTGNALLWSSVWQFYATFSITSLSPSTVIATSTTLLAVTGSSFPVGGPALYCNFASTLAPAWVQSSSLLSCTVPLLSTMPPAALWPLSASASASLIANISVSVQLGAQATADTTAPLPLLMSSSPYVSSVSPTAASPLSAFTVTLSGGAFIPNINFTCILVPATTPVSPVPHNYRLPATYINSSTLACSSPPLRPGLYNVAAVYGSGSETMVACLAGGAVCALTVQVVQPAAVSSIWPRLVSSAGGTIVTVSGSSFAAPCSCRWNNVTTSAATAVNSTTITCVSPSAAAMGITVGQASFAFACSPFPSLFVDPQLPLTAFTPPTVLSVYPTVGVTSLTSPLYIRGSSFQSTAALACRFNQSATSLSLPAFYLSPTLILCLPLDPITTALSATCTGDGLGVGSVGVGVTVNGVDYSSLTVVFSAYAVAPLSAGPTVVAVSPAVASGEGGELLTVTGSQFSLLASAGSCVFGLLSTAATVVNDSVLTCQAPAVDYAHTVNFSVSFNGGVDGVPTQLDRLNSSLPFVFLPSPAVTSVYPSSAASSGGSVLTVTGQSFLPSAMCQLDTQALSTAWQSSTVLLCTTVSTAATGSVVLEVSNVPGYFPLASNRTLSRIAFTLYTQPIVLSLTPSLAPSNGNTTITVALTAATSAPSTLLHCRFGGVSSSLPALWVDSQHVQCVAPPHAPSVVSVDVTLNGRDYTNSAIDSPTITFTFVASLDPTLTSIWPSTVPASGGSYLTLSGYSLTPATGSTAYCMFGALGATTASPVNDTTVTCRSPVGAANSSVAVSLLLTPLNYVSTVTTSAAVRLHFGSPSVLAVSPVWVSTAGTTTVYVVGGGFSGLVGAVQCVFNGAVSTPASVSSDGLLTCTAPAYALFYLPSVFPSDIGLSVSWASGSLLADGYVSVSYSAVPALSSLYPAMGVSTLLTITGSGFYPSPQLSCRIGSSVVSANYSSFTVLYCTAPRQPPGTYNVSTSINAVDWSVSLLTYTVLYDWTVLSMTPLISSLAGGTLLTLTGDYFLPTSQLACLFSPPGTSTAATYINSTTLTCTSPPTNVLGNVSVQVTVDGRNYSDAAEATLTYAAASYISTISPVSSYAGITSTLTISGSHFIDSSQLALSIGNLTVSSVTFISTSTIVATLPPFPDSTVAITVLPNNAASAAVNFTFLPLPVLSLITPARVVQSLAGDSVRVDGFNYSLVNALDLMCSFGTLTPTSLTYVSSTSVSCVVPTALQPGTVNVSLVLRSSPSVQVSANKLPFTYDADMAVVSYSPTSGPLSSYTVLTVDGTGFINSSLTQCRFGSVYSVVATVLSATQLQCTIPPRYTVVAADLSLYIDVLLTGNGQDYIALAPPFRFLLPTDCQPGTVCPPVFAPSTSIVGCPAGSYCPGTDSALLCSPGTFQPYPSQTSCLPCPPAFYCPTPGLTMPLLCPAGALCSSASIINPYLTPCDAGHFCLPGSILSEPLVAHTADTVSSAIGAARKLLTVVDAAGPNTTDAGDGLTAVLSHLRLYGAYSLAYNNSLLYSQLAAALASDTSVHVASQCMKGYYCLPGTATPYATNAQDGAALNTSLLSPIPCFPGYLCPSASVSPVGSAACPRAYYCPSSTLALPCPVGSYCPGETLEPIPCPPSTYNNLTAQPSCTACPTGYYCPVATLLAPIICPAGYVCDQPALLTPASLCPAGYWCDVGTTTADVSSTVSTAPQSCNASYFCLSGTVTAVPVLGNFSTPQLCTSGTYCLPTASAITGSASCGEGTYCPPGSSATTIVSVGYFVNYIGAPIQYQCLPGTFAPDAGASSCLPCPAGYSCNTVGADAASICAAGLYKSINNTICEPCPRGTFSQEVGLPDGSLCQPCLAGYVCGQEGLTGMTQATLCVEGYVCGDGTTAASQYDNPCPLGFVCGPGTTPATQYGLLCPAGFTCSGGVAESEENRSACRKGYYCPPGVYNQDVTGYTLAVECVVEQSSDVIDDFSCGASLITVARPYGADYIRPVGQCPLGTTSLISATHLDDCYLDPSWTHGAVWEFSPIDTSAVPIPASGRINGQCPYGYACPDNTTALNSEITTVPPGYNLRSTELVQLYIGHMDYMVVTLSWGNISTNLTYDTEFELYVYSSLTLDSNGAPSTMALPYSFTSSYISQHATLRLAFTCLVNTSITLSVGILHGLYLPQAQDFVNSGTVSIIQPNRAITNTRASFMTVYDFLGRSLFQPTNIPPLNTELVYGYQLSSVTLDQTVDLIVDSNAEQIAEDITTAMDNLGMTVFAFPYLPFFSNCRGYDSYINMYVAFQDNSSCTLVDTADIVAVGNFDFLSTPNSDSCTVQTDCLFEEDMSEVTSFPRWFDKSADQNTMFYIAQSPFDQSLWDELPVKGYPDLASYYAPQLGTDSLVAVIVNRDQNAPTDAFPRTVLLAIEYQQTDQYTKKVVTASVTLADFDTTLSNTAYNLTITLTPLGYFGLVNEFVFDETIFTIIYLIIGALTLCFVGVLWLLHRCGTQLHFPPPFRLFEFFDIMFPAATGAFMLWSVFPLFVCVLLYFLFVVPTTPLFASVSGNIASDLGNSSFDSAQVAFYGAGRIGCVLLAMALASMWAGARMFIPERRKRKQEKKADPEDEADNVANKKRTKWDDGDDTMGQADDDDLSLGQHDVYWTPKTWKRSNFLLVSIFTDLALLISIEFSYSNLFNQNQWYVIIAFKVAEIPINYLLRLTLQESLLTMPMQVIVDLVQFMITIGASNFVNFIIGFAVQDVALKYFERIWKDDIVDYCITRLESLTKKWEKLTKTTAEEEAELAEKEEKKAASGPLGYLWGGGGGGGGGKGKDESESEDDKEMVAPVLNSHETSEEILAPIVEFYSDYSAKVISLFFSPLLTYFLYLFRAATQMTVLWGIAQHDMFFYFLFICILLPFMMLLDIVLVNIKELCHFWKLYDYLIYLRFRFEHRTEWWHMHTASSPSLSEEKGKGKQINRAVSGDTMDMAMPRAWRSLDHSCFSGQYYFMLLVHTGGMVFLLIALEVFIHNNYNPFNDLLGLGLFAVTTLACYLFEKGTLLLAHSLPLWPLKPRRARVYMEQQYRGDTGIIPSWEREYGAAIEALKESEWYSVEGMRTIGFKQRWLKMNKEWVMDELMHIWKEGNEGGKGKNRAHKGRDKDGGDGSQPGGAEKGWLREWESGGGKEALLKQIAKALGLEENWDRHEDEGDALLTAADAGLLQPPNPSNRPYPNSDRNGDDQQEDDEVADENNVSGAESDGGVDDQLFTPPARQRSGLKREQQPDQQQSNAAFATTTSATKHRKHLLWLSHRYFFLHLPQRCSHCSEPATSTQPLVFLLSFPLSTVMRRFYARRRRQAAVTARANGHQRLNRGMVYERVSREQWAQWLDQELEWVAVCHDCAAKERAKRRQGEVTVLDVKKEMERMQRRKQRKQRRDGPAVSDSSDEDDEEAAEQPVQARPAQDGGISDDDDNEHDGEQADTAAYWHPPQRDDLIEAAPLQAAGEYSVSASSLHADERLEAEELESAMPVDVKEFLMQWMDKAQAMLERRAAVQQQAELALSARSRSRASSVSAVSISEDSQLTHRPSISSSSESSMSRQLHREDVEHGLVGLGRLDISSDSASDNEGATARGRSRRTSVAEVVTRDENDHAAAVSRQHDE